MDHLSSYLVAGLLIVSSAVLVVWHSRSWQRLREGNLSDRERDFWRRQYRRRMQTSAMLGVLGAAILVGQLLMPVVHASWFLLVFWGGVLVLVLWIVLLALADMVATSYYYGRERTGFARERAQLEAELRKARGEEKHTSNGKPR
jgi:hypothetical protein